MVLFVYDRAFNREGIIEEITSFIWTRRYWFCGEFKLLVPATKKHAQWLETGKYIARMDDTEVGEIRYISIRKDNTGMEQIEVQGKFLTHWLGKRLIMPAVRMEAPTHEIIQKIVRDNLVSPADPARRIPNLSIANIAPISESIVDFASEEYANALDVCSERARLAKEGIKITTDLRSRTHAFLVYKGVERTIDQNHNAVCVFSVEFDNVLSQEYTKSVENFANYIVVGGSESESAARLYAQVGDASLSGLDRVEFFYDASDIRQDYYDGTTPVHIEDEKYLRMLKEKGNAMLDQKTESVSFSSRINPNANFRYKRDFDVGDRVTCLNHAWRILLHSRITEVMESYEGGREDIDITFGVSLPKLYDAIKLR